MNILLLCTKFSVDENDGWLTNDMAQTFSKMGHFVQVICLDWSGKINQPLRIFTTSSGVKVTIISPFSITKFGNKFSKVTKWFFASFSAGKFVNQVFRSINFDLVIGFSPAVTMMMPIMMALKNKKIKSYFILWDFFPYHYQQVGLIKSKLVFCCSKKMEEYLIRKFDFIGCMSQKNSDYLKQHYQLKPSQQVSILRIWGKAYPLESINKSEVRQEFELPNNKIIAVFGGQLAISRGIEDILKVARISQNNNDNIIFLFIGNGSYESVIQKEISAGANNILLLQRIPRVRYLYLLAACDIALVCTVRNVDVPTFPSKTIDYFQASLPIVASVETSTDYGDWLVQWKAGIYSSAGDANTFYKNIKEFSCDENIRTLAGKNGYACFSQEMEVSKICIKLLEEISHE